MPEKRNAPQRLICRNPFEWFEIHPDGQVFACCPAWLKQPLGNLLTDELADIWNGQSARALRQAIHDGSFRRCNRKRCPRLTCATPPVEPLAEVKEPALKDILDRKQTLLPWGPRRLNLCYDRSCNLACPSCRPGHFVPTTQQRQHAARLSEIVQRDLAAQARQLIISGTGDPFASDAYRHLLQGVDSRSYPLLESIHLHSNGLLWNAASWQAISAAEPYVQSAEISVDAASAATYALNRGGDFAQLLGNLAFLSALPVAVTLSFVVQQNNFREMMDFVNLAHRFGFTVYFSQLVNWGTYRREEFRQRAVHLPEHPDHSVFRGLLQEVAGLQGVDIGNLRPLLHSTPSHEERSASL